MKVLLVGRTRRLFSQSNFQWVEQTLDGLRRQGYQATFFGFQESWSASEALARRSAVVPILPHLLKGYQEGLAERRGRSLVALARSLKPDLVLVIKGDMLSAEVLAEVREHSQGPVAAWLADDPWRFPDFLRMIRLYDHVFIWDRSYIPRLRAEGARQVHFLPAACDELVYRPLKLTPTEQRRLSCDVSFVAWYYPERGAVVRAFLPDVNLGVWGGGWESAEAREALAVPEFLRGPSVSTGFAAKIYSASKLGLNIHHAQTKSGGLNNRTFEQLASGLCALVDHVPGIEELLSPGEEVVCYRTPDEAYEMAKRYLKDEGARRRIAARGRARVLAEHTYARRISSLLELIRG